MMNTQDVVKRLSKVLGWEITPIYITGICFVIENAEIVGAVYTMPENPEYTLTVHSCNIIENFDAANPKHLEVFMALLNLMPPITTYIDWDILIKHLEKNGAGEITMRNVELAGCAM